MIYKLILVFVFLFSLKTFSAEQQNSNKTTSKDSLAKKQLEMIIKSIKEETTVKLDKAES